MDQDTVTTGGSDEEMNVPVESEDSNESEEEEEESEDSEDPTEPEAD